MLPKVVSTQVRLFSNDGLNGWPSASKKNNVRVFVFRAAAREYGVKGRIGCIIRTAKACEALRREGDKNAGQLMHVCLAVRKTQRLDVGSLPRFSTLNTPQVRTATFNRVTFHH